MTISKLMERLGMQETGRVIEYVKDALEELNLVSETHTKTIRMDINANQRFYEIPNEAVKILDIRAKHHKNENSAYQSIPRSIYEPETEDKDGI